MEEEVIEYRGHRFVVHLKMIGKLGEGESYWTWVCSKCNYENSYANNTGYISYINGILTCDEVIIKNLLE